MLLSSNLNVGDVFEARNGSSTIVITEFLPSPDSNEVAVRVRKNGTDQRWVESMRSLDLFYKPCNQRTL